MIACDFTKMTNSEIRLKLKELENEYNAKRVVVMETLNTLIALDEEYGKGSEELKKRSNGGFVNG